MTVPMPASDAEGTLRGVPGRAGPPSAAAARHARLAWIIGGSLLVAHGLLELVGGSAALFAFPGGAVVLHAPWAAALLVFAFGIRGAGSVVARRPVGVVALVIAGLQPLLSIIVWWVVPIEATDRLLSLMIGQSLAVLSLAALVVATVVIGRAGAVPYRVRWVPLLALSVAAAPMVLVQLLAASTPAVFDLIALYPLFAGAAIVGTLVIVLLGILAIVFAPREVPVVAEPVQVYPPSPPGA